MCQENMTRDGMSKQGHCQCHQNVTNNLEESTNKQSVCDLCPSLPAVTNTNPSVNLNIL